jgi:hypothetical protein
MVRAQQQEPLLTSVVASTSVHSEPVTVKLSPRSGIAPGFEAARSGKASVVLALEGVEGTSSQAVRVNVFLNEPQATRTTPQDDPHFLGHMFVWPTNGRLRLMGRAFDLPIDKYGDVAEPLQVTLVPVVGVDKAPRDLALHVEKIYLRVEPHEK